MWTIGYGMDGNMGQMSVLRSARVHPDTLMTKDTLSEARRLPREEDGGG